jgi:hypothetical protein
MPIEPAQRVIAIALNIRPNDSAAARFAGFDRFPDAPPGAHAPGFTLASAPRTLRIKILKCKPTLDASSMLFLFQRESESYHYPQLNQQFANQVKQVSRIDRLSQVRVKARR